MVQFSFSLKQDDEYIESTVLVLELHPSVLVFRNIYTIVGVYELSGIVNSFVLFVWHIRKICDFKQFPAWTIFEIVISYLKILFQRNIIRLLLKIKFKVMKIIEKIILRKLKVHLNLLYIEPLLKIINADLPMVAQKKLTINQKKTKYM